MDFNKHGGRLVVVRLSNDYGVFEGIIVHEGTLESLCSSCPGFTKHP